MRFLFLEARPFSLRVSDFLTPEAYREVQNWILEQPDAGAVITGTGGARKLRVPSVLQGKGKRGGCRVVYLAVPEASLIYLFAIYGKTKKDDLTAQERAELKVLTRAIREKSALWFMKGRRN